MTTVNKMVSIIIPAYNAAEFIDETIRSILAQTYPDWEAIIVDDGSKDDTFGISRAFTDVRINVIRQENAGVATARNKGLSLAKGRWVVFFDADDLMTPEFLEERVRVLETDPSLGYAGGIVETFPTTAPHRRAAGADPVNEILFFDINFVTVPSNYMVRRDVLVANNILFNPRLSSTADRFFILELSRFAKGMSLVNEKGKLLYRYTSDSMSNKITPKLIIDNETFYYELKNKNLLPEGRKRKFASFYFLSLAKGFRMIRFNGRAMKYIMLSFFNHPFFFIKNFTKSIFKTR